MVSTEPCLMNKSTSSRPPSSGDNTPTESVFVNEAFMAEQNIPPPATDLSIKVEDEEAGKAALQVTVEDPWALPELVDSSVPWKELDQKGKIKRVVLDYILRQVLIVVFLYLFICSLDLLSSGFRLLGGRAAGKAFTENELLSNPVAGLMLGVLGTVLLQSSSTTTSLVVSMVSSHILTTKAAIPIIMGANIGTTVTNTIVSLGQVSNQNDFRRAFGGATVHDMFNWLTVLVLLPLEAATEYLYYLTSAIVGSFKLEQYKDGNVKLLQTITEPLTNLVVQVDKSAISEIALSNDTESSDKVILTKICFISKTLQEQRNTTNYTQYYNVTTTQKICTHMFESVAGVWSDESIGAVVLILALATLCACLYGLVKMLQFALKGSVAKALKKVVHTDIPTKCGAHLTGYIYIVVGMLLTLVLQSSSVLTSTLTPLVGIGVLSLERMYPLTLGSNVGTTFTAILAALASDGRNLDLSLQVALCHLFFNVSGILLWYPIPAMRRVPLHLARKLGNTTARYRWFAVVYIIVLYFVFPAVVFGLSLAGWYVLLAVLGPVAVLFVIFVIITILQNKKPDVLPQKLRNWHFLPLWMRSLEPLNGVILAACCCCRCCQKLAIKGVSPTPTSALSAKQSEQADVQPAVMHTTNV